MPRNRSHEKVNKFKKKWGINLTKFEINGMEFEIEFRTMEPYSDKITAWISTEEDLAAEEVVMWMIKVGLLPIPDDEKIEVKWK